RSLDKLEEINQWLFPVFNANPYQKSHQNFGFAHTIGMIETPFEGQIHTGKMMKAFMRLVQSENISILNNIEVIDLSDLQLNVELELNNKFKLKSKKVFLCTNAFTRQLYDLDVVP